MEKPMKNSQQPGKEKHCNADAGFAIISMISEKLAGGGCV